MDVEALTAEQRRAVLRFLLYRMSMDTRRKLMAEMPVAYARLYPGTAGAVLEHVTEALSDSAMIDMREATDGVDWAGRTFGQLSPDEQRRVTAWAAAQLQHELNSSERRAAILAE